MSSSPITVVVRIRPLLPHEGGGATTATARARETQQQPLRRVVIPLDANVLVFDPAAESASKARRRTYAHGAKRHKEMRYAFDRVLSEASSQQDVFDITSRPLVDDIVNGFNATVFAYGSTGCGKTHTISGTQSDPGIIWRTMRELFDRKEKRKDLKIDLTLSYLEVYNEKIRDLLCVDTPSTANGLDLREDETRVAVAGLSEHRPENVEDVMRLLVCGEKNRTRAPTEANAVSSRSHAVLQVHLRVNENTAAASSAKIATLSIIDLAGSERASATKNSGDRLLEGANINRSLLALGNCINALCSDRPNHIPYRDSKLTRLLKFSLSGSCKVVMIANVSPSHLHLEETHNTLKYANRAKNIKTKLTQNVLDIESHISQYPKIIEALRSEVVALQSKLKMTSSTRNTSADAESLFIDFQRRIRQQYEKIDVKEAERVQMEHEISINDRRITLLKAALSKLDPLTESSSILLDDTDTQTYTSQRESISEAIDCLEQRNVVLRHNAGEGATAITRHLGGVEKLLSSRRITDPAVRSRLEAEQFLLSVTSENLRLVRIARLEKEDSLHHLASLEVVVGILSSMMKMCYEGISEARGRSNAAELLGYMKNLESSGSAVAIITGSGDHSNASLFVDESQHSTADASFSEDRDDNISLAYDSASETDSVIYETDEEDRAAGEEEHADGDGAHLDRAFQSTQFAQSSTAAVVTPPSIDENDDTGTAKKVVVPLLTTQVGAGTPTRSRPRRLHLATHDDDPTPQAKRLPLENLSIQSEGDDDTNAPPPLIHSMRRRGAANRRQSLIPMPKSLKNHQSSLATLDESSDEDPEDEAVSASATKKRGRQRKVSMHPYAGDFKRSRMDENGRKVSFAEPEPLSPAAAKTSLEGMRRSSRRISSIEAKRGKEHIATLANSQTRSNKKKH